MAHTIDERRCLKCGLCITNCPHQAIKGANPHSVSTSMVYDSVTIDPQLCEDCGTCLSMPYWCPAEAISENGAPEPTAGSADGTKYSKYIFNHDMERGFRFPEHIPFTMITRIDDELLPGSEFYLAHWVLPHQSSFITVGHPPHIHRDPELLFHIGSDPNDPQDLGATVEIFLGAELERHVITQSCCIYIPPNFIHAPWRPLETRRPWIFIEVNQGPRHTEKGYHQLLSADAIAAEPHLSMFQDEGY